MIPLISSISYGPAGLCHLPRFWWKVSLRARDLLAEDYPECSGGLDMKLLEQLGVEPEKAIEHIHGQLPNYLEFETWILDRTDKAEVIAPEWNSDIRERVHTRPHKLAEIYATLGWDDSTGPAATAGEHPTSAVVLNHLEDWHFFYHRDIQQSLLDNLKGKIVPLISSIDYGPLEVCHLPRTWLKLLLGARVLLHSDYPDFTNGLDRMVIEETLGLDRLRTIEYVRDEQPDYLGFEAWVVNELGGSRDDDAIAAWNKSIRNRIHKEGKRTEILSAISLPDDGSLISAVVLNQIEDWHFAHTSLIAD
jgi:hypothetical protein